jgi:hypothetical protein
MAEYTQGDDKTELIAQLDRARAQFAQNLDGLRRDADIGAHLKHSISAHKAAWIGSAGIAGWVLSRLPSRKKKVIVREGGDQKLKHIAEAGMILSILKTLFTLFRPVIMSFASKKIADIAAKNNRWQK